MADTQDYRDPSVLETLDNFLDEEGIREEVAAVAVKRVVAFALSEAMKSQNITKAAMAKMMDTSRTQIDRILDPNENNVTLQTLVKAAKCVGMKLKVELVDSI